MVPADGRWRNLRLAPLRPCCEPKLLTSFGCGGVETGCSRLSGRFWPSKMGPSRWLRVFRRGVWIERTATGLRAVLSEHGSSTLFRSRMLVYRNLARFSPFSGVGSVFATVRAPRGCCTSEARGTRNAHQPDRVIRYVRSLPLSSSSSVQFSEGDCCLHGHLRLELDCPQVRGTRRCRY